MSEAGILERPIETVDVHFNRDEIIDALRHDGKIFIQTFLADELQFDIPQFHLESWNLITAEMILYIALALPRGHAKTTLCKLCCVWYLLFTETRFIVYVSNTAAIAAEACKDIVAYIRSPNFAQIFGTPRFTVDRDNTGFYKFWITIPDGHGSYREKFCILKSLGAGQQVRGLNIDNERPQLAVVDDLEDNENTATPGLQQKLKKWFYGAFIKALSKKRRKVIFLGNMLSNQSILYHLCEKSEMWHSIRYGCLLSNNEPLWPDMWSFEDIRQDFIEYQRMGLTALWYAEMMNMPMAEGTALISADEIIYRPVILPGQQSTSFITVDPAISQKTWANESAVAVHAYVADRWQIAEVIHGKFEPEKLFQILVELCQKWNTRIVGIEQGGYQAGLRFIFEILMKSYNQTFYIYEVPHKNKPKVERLVAWCAAIRKAIWVLTEGDNVITQQLIMFDPMKTNNVDDIIDACSMGIVMIEIYISEIMEQFKFSDNEFRVTKVVSN